MNKTNKTIASEKYISDIYMDEHTLDAWIDANGMVIIAETDSNGNCIDSVALSPTFIETIADVLRNKPTVEITMSYEQTEQAG